MSDQDNDNVVAMCRNNGGHHWLPQVPGERNRCQQCGYLGDVFEPKAASENVAQRAREFLKLAKGTYVTVDVVNGWSAYGPALRDDAPQLVADLIEEIEAVLFAEAELKIDRDELRHIVDDLENEVENLRQRAEADRITVLRFQQWAEWFAADRDRLHACLVGSSIGGGILGRARAALAGNSGDAEHDALLECVTAIEELLAGGPVE